MEDLSHWNFAEEFYGYEAAALILGLEPFWVECGQPDIDQSRIRIVADRMKVHYENTKHTRYMELFRPEEMDEDNDLLGQAIELPSVHMQRFRSVWNMSEWFEDETKHMFEAQKFSRHHICQWLEVIGLKSVYPFDLHQTPSSTEAQKNVNHWPWGSHHTELLGHLEAAAQNFWVNHDPDDLGTLPTNVVVSGWLQKTRGVSKTMANSIASMLRPDGLPTGPRK